VRTIECVFTKFLWVNCKEKFPKLFQFLFTCWGRSVPLLSGCTNGAIRFPFPRFTFFHHCYHSGLICPLLAECPLSPSYHTGLAKFVSYISIILPTCWILVSYVFMKILYFQLLSFLYLHRTSNICYSVWTSRLKVDLTFLSPLCVVVGTGPRLWVISTHMSTIWFSCHIDIPVMVKLYFRIHIFWNGKGLQHLYV
jgi:hypothetical protein